MPNSFKFEKHVHKKNKRIHLWDIKLSGVFELIFQSWKRLKQKNIFQKRLLIVGTKHCPLK